MLFLLKLVALLGALFFVAGSLDNVLGGCDKSVKAQLDPQQCQLQVLPITLAYLLSLFYILVFILRFGFVFYSGYITNRAFQRLPRKGGFIIFDSASQTRECGNCLIELRAPSGGTIKK
ncbi:hypothetical protein DFH28DRAFT_929996 [Melampsora americana]|nr:hypothetical protein DFH28DRAFT_929996 [Melampsora americana]